MREPAMFEPIQLPDGTWKVRDTALGQDLLGVYEKEQAAINQARRLNAKIELSPNEARAFRRLAFDSPVSFESLAIEFWGGHRPMQDARERGIRLAELFRSHELATYDMGTGLVAITQWGKVWMGVK